MSYISEHLLIGERVIYQTTLHWIGFVRTAVGVAVLVAAGIALLSVAAPFGIGTIAIAGVVAFASWIEYKSAEFGVTNKRVILKEGFIRRRVVETLLNKVEGIAVDQSIPGRLLNYGTITITGTGGTHEQFTRIARPLEFRRQIHEQATLSDESK